MITPPITFWPFDSRNSLVSRLLHGVANDSETDIAMGLMPLLCTCAAVTQGKFAVGLPRADGLHAEPLCIMGISITEASERKSTVFNCFIAPIQEIEAEST